MKKLYKYELGFCDADTGQVYDRATIELTGQELADAINTPNWDWVELDEGPLRLSDREAWINYYRAPDGVEMDASELLEADDEDLICAGSASVEMRDLQLADLKRQYAEAIEEGMTRLYEQQESGSRYNGYIVYEPDTNRIMVTSDAVDCVEIQRLADIDRTQEGLGSDNLAELAPELAAVWWNEVQAQILDALDDWEG